MPLSNIIDDSHKTTTRYQAISPDCFYKESHKLPIIIQVAATRLPKLSFTLSQAYALQDRETLEQASYELANLSAFTGVPRLKRVAFFF